MELLDTRRLTGANVVWDFPGSVVDATCAEQDSDRLVDTWQGLARSMLDALGWQDQNTCVRRYSYGVSLALSAPIDALYAACEVNSWLWSGTVAMLEGEAAPNIEEAAIEFRDMIALEANPALVTLQDAAAEKGLAFLSDDEIVSVGLGDGSISWPVDALPDPAAVKWQELHDVPLALVTGTNGKTTTTRMVASMVAAAGRRVGMSTTDGIRIDDEIVELGDFSGPGGARTVLRDPRVQTAVLETARGGLLRRGLGVACADAVAITTIAEDHLGDFGSRSLKELLEAKWVLTRAISEQGQLILNADEPRLVEMARSASAPITWCSLDSNHPVVRTHVEAHGRAIVLKDGALVIIDEGQELFLCLVDEVPLTVHGAARHNISNALTAVGLALALGIDREDIARALRSASFKDNPGRCNLFEIDGKKIVVDYAHNPQAMAAIFDFARALPARRRLLSFGQAGDRPDAAIMKLAAQAWAIGLERIHTFELPAYERGRGAGIVCELLRTGLIQAGAPPSSIFNYSSELESLSAAMEWGEPGDLLLMMAFTNSAEVVARLELLVTPSE